MDQLDPFATINWADVVDSDSEDDYSTLGPDGSQPNALKSWIKSLNENGANLLAIEAATKSPAQISSHSVTLLKRNESQSEQMADTSSRSTPMTTSSGFEENDNNYNEHDDIEDRVPVSPQFARVTLSSSPRLPKSPFSPTRVLVLATEQDQKINMADGAVRHQQQRGNLGQRRNQPLDKLERELNGIKAAQREINIALRSLKLNDSSKRPDNATSHLISHGSDSCPRTLGDRVYFDRCSQLLDETFDDFYRRLSKVASKAQLCCCCADQRIATRIALGLRNRAFSKELMELTPFPTAKQIVEICRANETIDQLMNRTPCAGCGQMKHRNRNKVCPALGLGCNRCKGMDHFFIVCPLNSKSQRFRDFKLGKSHSRKK